MTKEQLDYIFEETREISEEVRRWLYTDEVFRKAIYNILKAYRESFLTYDYDISIVTRPDWDCPSELLWEFIARVPFSGSMGSPEFDKIMKTWDFISDVLTIELDKYDESYGFPDFYTSVDWRKEK